MKLSIVSVPEAIEDIEKRIYNELKTQHSLLLHVLNYLFSTLIVCTLVVGCWRSVWNLMGIYVYPEDDRMSNVVSTLIGWTGHFFLTLSQHILKERFHPKKSRILYYAVSRMYTLCFSIISINECRGPWNLLGIYDNDEAEAVLISTGVSLAILILLKTVRNLSSSPFVVCKDYARDYFDVTPMLNISVDTFSGFYLLDSLFSILIVGILVVFIWRGVWVLTDIFLFPDDLTLSSWGSLVIGYAAVVLAFMLQPGAKHLCERFKGTARLLVVDVLNIFALFGTVNVWRGIWNLLDIYFLPDDPVLSNWITHWVCFLVLVALGCSNTILVRGVFIDAEEPEGECVEFPCHYLQDSFLDKLQRLKSNSGDNSKSFGKNEKALDSFSISVIQVPPLENSTNVY